MTTNLRMRDGESNLMAGLLRDDERRQMRGFPGVISVPILKQLFSDTDNNISQTDIVMLLTPRIIRTHEYTARDLSPIYVGTNQNFGLTGPPPLIAAPPETPETPPAQPAPPLQGVPPQGLPFRAFRDRHAWPGLAWRQAWLPARAAAAASQRHRPLTGGHRHRPMAQVTVTAPSGDVRVAGGPYMVPVFISGASRVSTITVTVSFNPAALRVRTIQEGSFLRQGGTTASFTNKVDAVIGRVDLTFVRTGDTLGASGSGLLAAILFDAVGTGSSQLNVSGVATDPTGSTIPVQFIPASIVMR